MAPEIGLPVTPEFPTYHWKVGVVPEAVTPNVAVLPVMIVMDTGWVVKTGGIALASTVTIAVLELAVP